MADQHECAGRAGSKWSDREKLVFLIHALDKGCGKLDWGKLTLPAGRTQVACQRMLQNTRESLKPLLADLEVGRPFAMRSNEKHTPRSDKKVPSGVATSPTPPKTPKAPRAKADKNSTPEGKDGSPINDNAPDCGVTSPAPKPKGRKRRTTTGEAASPTEKKLRRLQEKPETERDRADVTSEPWFDDIIWRSE